MSRLAACVVLFAASGLLVVQRADPLGAQDKAKKDDPAALQKQVATLQKDLQAATTQVTVAQATALQAAKETAQQKAANNKLQADNAQLDALLKKEKADAAKADKTAKELQAALDGVRKPGVVRVMVLRLKEDSPANEVPSLIDGAQALAKVKGVRVVWAGKPAGGKARGSEGDADFTVAVVLAFEDAAALKAFLKDAVYDKFADRHLKLWETPTIYDFEPKKPQ
jgi:hypothetical protein